MHAHGGPPLGEPKASRAEEDVRRWSVMLQQGHAWAGSVFREAGFAVLSAAQDTETVRRIFVAHVATPRRTLLHGQSFGALVAAKAAEHFPRSWDGLLLSSAAVGGLLAYDFRLDLRSIYQNLCNNHPRPDEAAYPLSIGLPEDNPLTKAQLAARVNEALGVHLPAASRSDVQANRLRTLVDVLKITEDAVADQLRWATFTLRDVTQKHGGSPVGNENVRYLGDAIYPPLIDALLKWVESGARPTPREIADRCHNLRLSAPIAHDFVADYCPRKLATRIHPR